MNSQLIDFHINCKKELSTLMKSFNILFYGYGSKKSVLLKMFPSAFHFNCKIMTHKDILNEIMRRLKYSTDSISSIREMDDMIGTRRVKYKLIMTNFDFNMDFIGLKNFVILGTIEEIDIKFKNEDIERLNFIFRDLTTFESYDDEIMDVQFKSSSIESSFNVIRNVPRNSRLILREILLFQTDVVKLDDLFEKVKRMLFLTSKSAIIPMINEFVDHRILRIKNGDIHIILSSMERGRIMKELTEV